MDHSNFRPVEDTTRITGGDSSIKFRNMRSKQDEYISAKDIKPEDIHPVKNRPTVVRLSATRSTAPNVGLQEQGRLRGDALRGPFGVRLRVLRR